MAMNYEFERHIGETENPDGLDILQSLRNVFNAAVRAGLIEELPIENTDPDTAEASQFMRDVRDPDSRTFQSLLASLNLPSRWHNVLARGKTFGLLYAGVSIKAKDLCFADYLKMREKQYESMGGVGQRGAQEIFRALEPMRQRLGESKIPDSNPQIYAAANFSSSLASGPPAGETDLPHILSIDTALY